MPLRSSVAAVAGDPHFVTLGGNAFTFNGAGEYWFLKRTATRPLLIQTRFLKPDVPGDCSLRFAASLMLNYTQY